ncbi:MAG: transposase [Candidatus Omnitrophica bacterium]|nr:transposase [Candidatus Omnitrophota bacterium]
MGTIKRHFEDKAIYFVTTVTNDRTNIFVSEKAVNLLLLTIEYFKITLDYKVYAYCLLPEHLHILIHPIGKYNLSYIMQMIKGDLARRFNRMNNIIGPVWQKRFYDEGIRSETMLLNKMEYIHNNPVKHKLVMDLNHYPHSSYHHYYKKNCSVLHIDKLEF